MYNKLSICLTCAGGSLKQQEGFFLKKYSKFKKVIYLTGTDIYPKKINNKIFDNIVKLPKPNSSQYIKKLIQVIKNYQIKILLVCSDEEAIKITKNINKINKYNCVVALNKFSTIKILSNKILTYKILSKIKKIIPKWNEVKNTKNLNYTLKKYLNKFGGAVVKPAISRGGRDVFIIENKKKNLNNKIGRTKEINLNKFMSIYLKKIKNKFPLIVMEKLYEPTFDLDMFCNKGKIINAVLRKRIVPKDPNSGHKIIFKKQIISSAKQISIILKLNYINDCDFMVDKNNNFKLLEINPRPSGSLAIPNIAGFAILDNLLDLCIKGKKFKKTVFFKKNVTISKKNVDNYITV